MSHRHGRGEALFVHLACGSSAARRSPLPQVRTLGVRQLQWRPWQGPGGRAPLRRAPVVDGRDQAGKLRLGGQIADRAGKAALTALCGGAASGQAAHRARRACTAHTATCRCRRLPGCRAKGPPLRGSPACVPSSSCPSSPAKMRSRKPGDSSDPVLSSWLHDGRHRRHLAGSQVHAQRGAAAAWRCSLEEGPAERAPTRAPPAPGAGGPPPRPAAPAGPSRHLSPPAGPDPWWGACVASSRPSCQPCPAHSRPCRKASSLGPRCSSAGSPAGGAVLPIVRGGWESGVEDAHASLHAQEQCYHGSVRLYGLRSPAGGWMRHLARPHAPTTAQALVGSVRNFHPTPAVAPTPP